jgi:hypothetical protein
MKKIVKLTESDLARIVKRIIKENENASEIDKVLDKINKYGRESLTFREKQILDYPDDTDYTFIGGDNVHKFISLLVKNNLVDVDDLIADSDNEVLYAPFDDEINLVFKTNNLDNGVVKYMASKYTPYYLNNYENIEHRKEMIKKIRMVEKWERVLGIKFDFDGALDLTKPL